jgi:hypothetical protein
MTPLSLLFAYFTVGFVTTFPAVACSYELLRLGFTAADMATVAMFASLPWCMKPLWAYVSDTFPVCGYRRRPYVGFFSLLTSALLVLTPQFAAPSTTANLVAVMACTSWALCVTDVAVDGSVMNLVALERGANEEGKAQTHSWIARVGGGALAAGWSGWVYEEIGFQSLMTGCAALPAVLAIVSLNLPDARTRRTISSCGASTVGATLRTVFRAMRDMRWVLFAAVVVAAIPETNTSLFFYLYSAHATPKDMSLVDTAAAVSSMLTLGAYNSLRPSHRSAFGCGVFLNALAAAIGCLMANDNVPWLLQGAAFQAALGSVGGALVLMPVLTLLGKSSARTKHHEATVYSFALSILNLASVVSEMISAATMRRLHVTRGDVNNVRWYVGCVSVLTLMAIPVCACLPASSASTYHAVDTTHTPNRQRKCQGNRQRDRNGVPMIAFALRGDDSSSEDDNTTSAESERNSPRTQLPPV